MVEATGTPIAQRVRTGAKVVRQVVQVHGARVVLGNTTRNSLVEERLQRSWGCARPEGRMHPR